ISVASFTLSGVSRPAESSSLNWPIACAAHFPAPGDELILPRLSSPSAADTLNGYERCGGGQMAIRGVIFDFNGTLFWDGDKNEAAWRAFALRHAGRTITDQEFLDLHGRPNREFIGFLL